MTWKLDAMQLAATAFRVRETVIRMSTDGGCFIGASLSCVDLFVYLIQQSSVSIPALWTRRKQKCQLN